MTFKVQVRPSGHEFPVQEGETILDAALHHGYAFPYGCRNGACGACAARVLGGEVDYGDNSPMALSDDEIAQGMALCCQAMPASDVVLEVHEIDGAGELEVKTLPCKLERMERLADDVMRLYLKLPDSERLQFMAGQYLNFILEDGRKRAFSIANAPHDDAFIELHVRHVEGGAFTDHVFNDMREKEILRIEGPLGTFFLREDTDRPVILVGGGTGFAPLKGMLEHAFHIGMDKPMHLFWGVRARADLYLDELVRGWLGEHPNLRYTPVLSSPGEQDAWDGATGYVHEAVIRACPDLSGHEVYMSGPPAMIQAAKDAFLGHGLPVTQLYSDSFDFAGD